MYLFASIALLAFLMSCTEIQAESSYPESEPNIYHPEHMRHDHSGHLLHDHSDHADRGHPEHGHFIMDSPRDDAVPRSPESMAEPENGRKK